MTIKCPICGGEATIGWYPRLQEGECWCHDCGVSIRKHFDSREDAEPYFENFGKQEPQTADEMFEELGFTKIENPEFYAKYIRLGEYSCKIIVRDCGNMLDFEVDCGDSFATSLSGEEIAACDQLSKEWRTKKEKGAES